MRTRQDPHRIATLLTRWLDDSEYDSPTDVHKALIDEVGIDEVPSDETIRLIFKGEKPKVQPLHLGMIAALLGHDASELDAGAGKVLAFVGGRHANPTQPPGRHEHGGIDDQDTAGSPCTEPLAA